MTEAVLAKPADAFPVPETAAGPTSREKPQDRVPWCPEDIVDEWGADSFPASDPPANW